MYYCENPHLFRYKFKHTYAFAIYYGMNAQIMVSQCNATHLIDQALESTVLNIGEQLLQSNLSRLWTLVGEPHDRPFLFSSKVR